MTESMAYRGRMAINAIGGGTTTFNGSSIPLEYLSHSIKESIERLEDDGIRGTRSRASERIALGNVKVAGQLKLQPTPVELEALMPFIMGTASAAGTYALADALTDMYMMIDNIASVDTYLLRISKATFEAKSGERLSLTLDVVGKTLTTGAAGSFPGTVPATDLTVRAYQFYDNASGITVAGTAYSIDQFKLTIDNKIDPTYMMGQTATDLEATDRKVMVDVRTKYTSTELGLWTAARAGTAQTGSASFTNGANTFSMTFGKLIANAESVVQEKRDGKIRLSLSYGAYTTGTTKELVCTLPA